MGIYDMDLEFYHPLKDTNSHWVLFSLNRNIHTFTLKVVLAIIPTKMVCVPKKGWLDLFETFTPNFNDWFPQIHS